MVRFCLVPILARLDPTTGAVLTRGPKYFAWRFSPAVPLVTGTWAQSWYGAEPLMVVGADLSAADWTLLGSQSDVTLFAADLDTPLGTGLAAMQTALESLRLPSSMLTAATLNRVVLRGIVGIFGIAQCMEVKGYDIFAGAITLDTTMAAIPVAPRQALSDCMTGKGYDVSGVTGTTTVRQLLAGIATAAGVASLFDVAL